MEKQAPPLRYVSQRLVDRSGIPFITMTGKQLQKLPPPPATAIHIAVARSIAAASGAVPPETPLLTVNLW